MFAARFCHRLLLLFPVKTGGEGKLFLLLVFFGRLPKFSRGGGGGGSHDGKKKGAEIGQTKVPLIFPYFVVISIPFIRNFRNAKRISHQPIKAKSLFIGESCFWNITAAHHFPCYFPVSPPLSPLSISSLVFCRIP